MSAMPQANIESFTESGQKPYVLIIVQHFCCCSDAVNIKMILYTWVEFSRKGNYLKYSYDKSM